MTFRGAKEEDGEVKAGTYSYKITVNDVSRVVRVTVVTTDDDAPSRYVLRVNGADLKVENKKVTKDVTIELIGKASNGTDMLIADIKGYGEGEFIENDFKLEITAPKDGDKVEL